MRRGFRLTFAGLPGQSRSRLNQCDHLRWVWAAATAWTHPISMHTFVMTQPTREPGHVAEKRRYRTVIARWPVALGESAAD
jgi:hypothetical protein